MVREAARRSRRRACVRGRAEEFQPRTPGSADGAQEAADRVTAPAAGPRFSRGIARRAILSAAMRNSHPFRTDDTDVPFALRDFVLWSGSRRSPILFEGGIGC